jgi:hypothetical protein
MNMKRSFRLHLPLLVSIVAAVAALPLAQLAHAGPPAPPVPTDIAVPSGHKLFLVGHAVGVQIYVCNTAPTGSAWSFVAPRAELYADNGALIGTHFGGPTWQARDGSQVVARLDGRVIVDPTAIPWLRLAVDPTAAGSDGGRLEGTTYIQRIATTGGLAPAAAACNANSIGTIEEVPYTADYSFWKATATGD